jgi:hypothetical protein
VDVEKPGQALSRDLSSGSRWDGDAEVDRFIQRRSIELRRENQERREQEAWAESTRKANALRESELREQWCEYHQDQAERHKAVLVSLIEHHEQRAQQLSNQPKGAA